MVVNQTTSSRSVRFAYVAVLAVPVLSSVMGLLMWLQTERPAPTATPSLLDTAHRDAESKCIDAVMDSRTRDLSAVEQSLAPLNEYFEEARGQARPMVEDLCDIGSTAKVLYKLGHDQVTGSREVDLYVDRFVRKYLGMPDRLGEALDKFRDELKIRLEASEQELYRQLEPELKSVVPDLDFTRFKQEMSHHVGQSLAKESAYVAKELHSKLLAVEGVAIAVDMVVTRIATRLVMQALTRAASAAGVRGGLLATEATVVTAGAANGWWSFGTTLFAGVVVAIVIDAWLGEQAVQDAAEKLERAIDELRETTHRSLEKEVQSLLDGVQKARLQMVRETFARGGL